MPAIFISYRRDDTEGQAGRLFDDLAAHFGAASVFMDVAGIDPGRDFRRVIDENVSSCGVVLVIIGRGWLDAKDEEGRPRLNNPLDFVRLETASALKRDIPVIPVLVQGTRMPRAEQLPEEVRDLAYRNGVELTHARWDSDVRVLLSSLERFVGQENIEGVPSAPKKRRRPLAVLAAGFFLLALVLGTTIYRSKTWLSPATVRVDEERSAEKVGDRGEAAATVNGKVITMSDVERDFHNKTASLADPPSAAKASAMRRNILEDMIDNELVAEEGARLGLLATDNEVEHKLSEIKSGFTEDRFNQRLKERLFSLDDLKRDLRQSITVLKVLDKEISAKIYVSDAEISDYYDAHKAEYNMLEPEYHLAHIVVTTNKAQNEAEALRKIRMIANRLDSGEDFGTLAINYSEDTKSSGNKGDLGFVPESSLRNTDPGTRDAVLKLKGGQYSPIITVTNPTTKRVVAFRIVRLIAREPAGQRELSDEQVQQAIKWTLHDIREQVLRAAYCAQLRKKAKIHNYLEPG